MEIGGLNAAQIVNDLMALERQPLLALEARQTAAEEAATAIGGVRTRVDAFRLSALKLSESDSFSRFAATSSNSSAVTASVTGNAVPSSISFSVSQLAQAQGLRSVNTVADPNSVVTTSPTISLARNSVDIGVGTVRATAGLAAGDQDVTVTQASAAAVRRSDTPLAASTDITGLVNDSLSLEVDGVAATLTLTAGTYTAQELADEVSTQLSAAGLAATAALDADGNLAITTNREGSAASVQITGGTALGSLNLTVDGAALTGTDAIVDVAGTTTTLTDVGAGSTATVATPDGNLELDLTGGLRVGTLQVTTVDVGGGTLAEVASAINGANAGISAAAVRTGDNAWRLQLSSRTAGDQGEMLIDTNVFAPMGGMVESSSAQNAQLVIGQGAGAYTVESSTNTFSDVLGGVSLTVSETTTDAVMIDVERDDSALSKDVADMVSAANSALAEIGVQTRYGVDGLGDGALAGNGAIRRLADQLRDSLSRPVDGSTMIGADVGIEILRDGSFRFAAATFEAAMADDPDGVAAFFGRQGATPANVTFLEASAETTTGSYAVDVTTAATQATSATLFAGGAAANSRVGVRVGDVTTTVDVTAGQSAAALIDTFNAAFAANGVNMTAEVDGTGLRLRSDDWGSAGDFELNTDVLGAGTWDAVAGDDVAGTIDGIAATGTGRRLFLNELVDSPAAGVSLQIEGGVTGALGNVDYQPGLAARVAELTTFLVDDEGTLETVADAQQRRIEDFNDQIDRFEDRLLIREETLLRQWSSLSSLLEGLNNQGNFILSQLASLPQV